MEESIKKKHIFTNKALMALIIPLMIEQLLAVSVGIADSIMVASVGEAAVSGVSLVDAINILLINLFAALATGGAVVAGQYIGKNKNDKAKSAGGQLIVFVTIISLVIMVLMLAGKNFILSTVFGAIDPDVAGYANTYMTIVFFSIPFIAIYNSGAALFRTMGNSKVTMNISIIMNGINIIGNAILIYGFKMGVVGAAIPTLISRAVGAIIIIVLLRDEKLVINIRDYFKFKFDKLMIKDILRVGVPNGIENSMFQLGKILLLSVVAGFGTSSIAANAVANTVTGFQMLPGAAIGLALITVISQSVGADDYEQARYYTKLLHKYAYLSLLIINGIVFLATPFILKAFNLSLETSILARKVIFFYGINVCIAWAPAFTLPNALRAARDVKFTMIVSIASMWITRIGLGIFFAKVMNFGMFGVWMGMFADWYVRSFFFIARFLGNKWEKKSKTS